MGEDFNIILADVLKNNLAIMKGKLGKACTYLSFEKEGATTFLRANLINSSGGKDTIRQKINVDLKDLLQEDFENMFNVLNTKAYDC